MGIRKVPEEMRLREAEFFGTNLNTDPLKLFSTIAEVFLTLQEINFFSQKMGTLWYM